MKKLFLLICLILYLIPVCGQNDTLNAEGLFPKYQSTIYLRNNSGMTSLTMEKLKNKDFTMDTADISNFQMVRGELDRVTNLIGLTYKNLPQYIVSEMFHLKDPPINPTELLKTTGCNIISQWVHEDGECILFIKCPRVKIEIDKSIDQLPEDQFYFIQHTLNMDPMFGKITEEQMKKVRKIITIWPPEKSKKVFNAQYVITYPIKDKKSVFMGKYTHKLELIMIKWGQDLSVSFLVTKKGNKNLKKYIADVENAFRFID